MKSTIVAGLNLSIVIVACGSPDVAVDVATPPSGVLLMSDAVAVGGVGLDVVAGGSGGVPMDPGATLTPTPSGKGSPSVAPTPGEGVSPGVKGSPNMEDPANAKPGAEPPSEPQGDVMGPPDQPQGGPNGPGQQACTVPRDCTFEFEFSRFTPVQAQSGQPNTVYAFTIGWGEHERRYPATGTYLPLAVGAVEHPINSDLPPPIHVRCGETRTLPVWVRAVSNQVGEVSTNLVLECRAGLPNKEALETSFNIEIRDSKGKVTRQVNPVITTRATRISPCEPFSAPNLSPLHCDIAVDFEKFFHDNASPGNEQGAFSFEVSAGGNTIVRPVQFTYPNGPAPTRPYSTQYFVSQNTTQYIAPKEQRVASFRVPCGQHQQVPLSITGMEANWISTDSGTTSTTLDLSCPMVNRTVRMPLYLKRKPDRPADHILEATFKVGDVNWARFTADGANTCCSNQCPTPCPHMGTFDGANCYVGAPPAPAEAFLWSSNPLHQSFYYKPLSNNPATRCPVGGYDGANCYWGSAPTETMTAFLWNNAYYVEACDPLCVTACPHMGTFDGTNCYIGAPPPGTQAVLSNGTFYYKDAMNRPIPCPVGQNTPGPPRTYCRWGEGSVMTAEFIANNAYYVRACKP